MSFPKTALFPSLTAWRKVLYVAAFLFSITVYISIYKYLWRFVSYPIELEWREGPYWLHALAQSYGINIFENDKIAYMMATHGIFDHLIKAALLSVFLSWEPQYILRFFVLIFPVVSFFSIFVQSRRSLSAIPALISALCLNGAMLVALHDIGHWFTCVGRSDPTALTLLAIAYLCYATHRSFYLAKVLQHFSSLAIALVLSTNWKWYPIALMIPLIMEQRQDTLRIRELIRIYLVILGYTVATCALFAVVWFHGDISFYFRYFVGLFFGKSPYAGSSAPFQTIIHYVRTPAIAFLILFSVLPAFIEAWRLFRKHSGNWPRTLAAIAVLVSLLIQILALKMNFMAGGYWYLCPQVIVLVIYYNTRYKIGPGLATVILVLGLCILWRSDNLPLMRWYYAQLGETLPAARKYTQELILLDHAVGIYSEEAHLFRRSKNLPPIDMGDGSENLAKVNYFGPRFTSIFEGQRSRVIAHQPVLLFVGACPSSAFKALSMNEEYCLLLNSPAPAIGGGVYVRIDHMEDVQRVLMGHAANPQ